MHQVSVEEATAKLAALLNEVLNGGEVVITKGNQPVAKLVSVRRNKPRRRFGSARHLITIAPDFKAPLPDFAEYTQ